MAEQDPPTLNYQSPGSRPAPLRTGGVRKFFSALLLGAGVSAILWTAGWKPFVDQGNGLVLIGWPTLKFVLAIVLLFFPNWRTFSAGLLASIPIGALIFFGSCAVNLKFH